MKKESYSFVRTERIAGTGIVRSTRLSAMKLFISSELVKYIDEHYKTIADRKGRAITGLSMGGHGAMWNAIRHKDMFGASGSTSGGMDIRPFPKKLGHG